jgi:hypothetical protein
MNTDKFYSVPWRFRSNRDLRSSTRIRVILAVQVVAGAIILGMVVTWNPVLAVAALLCLTLLAAALVQPNYLPRAFLRMVGVLLIGYAFLGKNFAYIGAGSIYIGDLTLGLGVLAVLVRFEWLLRVRSSVVLVLAILMVWGASRAIPYFPIYGFDTLRDSALWGYGAYAVILTCFLPRSSWLDQIPLHYGHWLPRFLIWAPVGLVVSYGFHSLLWSSPLTGESMALMKGGDAGAHLGGIAAFLLLGLNRHPTANNRRSHRPGWVIWAAWLVAFMCVLTFNRGGGLAAVVAVGLVTAMWPRSAVGKIPIIAALAVTGALVLVSVNFDIELGRRDLSPQQLVANVASIAGIKEPGGTENLEDTREWRFEWWEKILGYTIHGRYFWTGKGFGVNLAHDDGITKDKANRSPHSVHMTFLARSGVPGLLLWCVLNSCFAATLLRAYLRARRGGMDTWARLDLWILAYWASFIANASFDVFLEGPQGGIWFWSLIGYGISVACVQGQSLDRQRATSLPVNGSPLVADHKEAAARSRLLPVMGR